ncbi:MAG: threonine ammonia-lyase [Maricaulaceae bacterium]
MTNTPNYDDVVQAAKRLSGHAYATPLIRSDFIDDITGKKIWFKPECMQKVGAFKYRGAYNRLSAMSTEERSKGVVAFSSGNHAQGVSRSAKELGMNAIIVMPEDAPAVKVAGVKNDGAEIVLYDRLTQSREKIAADIAARYGRIIVPSYDDPYIIAGQGTVGLEAAQNAAALGFEFDGIIMPMGGGGLCAGISLAMQELSPNTQIFGAEPIGYNDHQLSLRNGERTAFKNPPQSICDAVMTPIPGELTWPINSQSLSDVFTADDDDCIQAMALAKREMNLTVEPGGAVAFAAVLKGAFDEYKKIQTICVVLSGGNVDPDIMSRVEQVSTHRNF